MKKHRTLFLLVVAYGLVSLVCGVYASSTTLVFNGSTHTVNEKLGYILSPSSSTVDTYDQTSISGAYNVSHGIRVFLVDSRGTETEVTNGSVQAVVTRNDIAAGIQSSIWSCPDSNNSVSDALVVRVYRRFGAASWSLRSTFLTRTLNMQLSNSTWTVYYYTYRGFTGSTYGRFFWGNSTYYSRIENVYLSSLSVWSWMDAHLKSGNFVGFLLAPYFNPLGELAYGLMLLLIAVPLYNRTENLSYVAIVFVLFGGTSGLLTLLVPSLGLNLANVLLVVGIAVLAYRTVVTLRHR